MKQMFEISEQLITEQSDEINGRSTMNWENSSWKYLSLVGDEEAISLLHTKVYVFSDSVLCLGNVNENPQSNIAWKEWLTWFKSSPEYKALDKIDGEPMEFEWNIFPGFTTLQLCSKVQELLSRSSVEPEEISGRVIFMSMFNDISWGSKDNKKCKSSAQLVSLYAKRFGAGHWSFLGPGSEKKWYSTRVKTVHKENGTELKSKWCSHLQKANTQSSDPRVHYPDECLKAKVVENCQYTIALTRERLKLFFAQSPLIISPVFTEQPQICVKNVPPAMIEHGDLLWKDNLTHCSCQVWWRHTYLKPMILHKKKIYCKDKERIEKLSQQDRVSKFCTDAGFLTTVEVGQYLMTKGTEEFSQFTDSVACREYTLPRDEIFVWTRRLDSGEH